MDTSTKNPEASTVSEANEPSAVAAAEIAAAAARQSATPEGRTPEVRRRLWIAELWDENREPFKVLFGHACLLIFCVMALEAVGYVIDLARLPDDTKHNLHLVDDLLIMLALVILGFGFIMKIGILVARDLRNERKGRHKP
jgi:hypothetical protein